MSTLKDTLLQRRMEEPDAGHPCYSANAEASTLLVEASNGENRLLPWQHFLEGRQQTVAGSERLPLSGTVSDELAMTEMFLTLAAAPYSALPPQE